MAEPHIRFERRNAVAWLTLNRPEKLNAIAPQTLDELDAAIDRIVTERDIRAVVLAGAGRAFCAGADLAEVKGFLSDPPAFRRFLERWHAVFNRFEALDRPTIAAINGYALAGGLELVLVCDLAIAAESARIGDAHANYGLLPGGGGTQRLPRLIGPRRAKMLFFTGEWVTAAEAERLGLINQVVPDDKLHDAALALAEKIASKSPIGLAAIKRLVNRGLRTDVDTALEWEITAMTEHLGTADCQEGLAAFAAKRAPVFPGR